AHRYLRVPHDRAFAQPGGELQRCAGGMDAVIFTRAGDAEERDDLPGLAALNDAAVLPDYLRGVGEYVFQQASVSLRVQLCAGAAARTERPRHRRHLKPFTTGRKLPASRFLPLAVAGRGTTCGGYRGQVTPDLAEVTQQLLDTVVA